MIYTSNIIIPANTVAEQPICERLIITSGLIYKVELQFPPGCLGLAHVYIKDGGYQVWPSTPSTDFACDDYTINFEDTFMKQTEPFELQIYGYNEDETYEHTIQVRIGQVSEDIFIARYLPTVQYDYMLATFEKQKEAEEQLKQQILANPFEDFFGR